MNAAQLLLTGEAGAIALIEDERRLTHAVLRGRVERAAGRSFRRRDAAHGNGNAASRAARPDARIGRSRQGA